MVAAERGVAETEVETAVGWEAAETEAAETAAETAEETETVYMTPEDRRSRCPHRLRRP